MTSRYRHFVIAPVLATLLVLVAGKAMAITPQAGWWWNPAESGRGFTLESQNGSLFFAGYLYDPSGRATWYAAGPVAMSGSTFSAPLTTYLGGQTLTGTYRSPTGTIDNGNVSITFSDTSHGSLTWPGGTIPIQRYDIVPAGSAATPPSGTPEAGWWWNAAEGGRGFTLEIQNGTMFMAGYMYDNAGNPVWYASGPTPMANAYTYTYQGTWQEYGNGQTLTGPYKAASPVNANVGNVTVIFDNATTATMSLPDGRTIPLTRYVFAAPAPGPLLDLPMRAGDHGQVAYGIWPYGVHGSSHSYDGHPGFDFEYIPGSNVLAAYDATIYAIMNDIEVPGRFTFNLLHNVAGKSYQTFYTNIQSIAPGIVVGAAVAKGTPLGVAGVQNQYIGSSQVAFAMTHFQLNDNAQSYGLSNPGAVSPESYFSPAAKAQLDSIWNLASYRHEICEPLQSNPRGTTPYPTTVRSWSLKSGSHHARIEFKCIAATPSSENYTLYDGNGNIIETGTVNVQAKPAGLSWMDLQPAGGSTSRLAIYDIVNGTMRIDYGAAGVARPSSLSNASTYCNNTPNALCK